MAYNSDRNRSIRYQCREFAPQSSQTTPNSYHSPSYKQHKTQYVIPAPPSDENYQCSDTNSTTNLSETTFLPRSEKERLIHEETEGDRRRYDQWKQWARELEEARLASAVENARREEYRCKLEALDRQKRENEKLKASTDRDRRVYLQRLEADEQSEADRKRREADRRVRSRTSSSNNNHSRREQATGYVSGTSGRRLPYTPLSDEALIGIAKESEKRRCRSSKSKYSSSRPELRFVPHNENLRGGKVCENYLDHEERRKKRKELISQQTVPDFSNSRPFQPESHSQLDPDYPKIPDDTFRRPTVIIQQEPMLPPYHGYQYSYPRERESAAQYTHAPVMTPTQESTPSPYGGYGYAAGYSYGQPNPQYIPVPGSATPNMALSKRAKPVPPFHGMCSYQHAKFATYTTSSTLANAMEYIVLTYADTRPKTELQIHTGIGGVCDDYAQHEQNRREREREWVAQIEASNDRVLEWRREERRQRYPQIIQEPRGTRASTSASASSSRHRHFSRGHRGSGLVRDSGSSPSHTF
ncbi:hypothetical protein BHYA_0054g00150 [Botrytis hyacinthi]|uniref:Uncharacterized protein n=1 Tax=Botrytis hyacinthi TaxID=278943 RepID=A0A4Z1GUI6_9HELO|nr:hypothetical protein BHYA_0054g00150 [Botrytis hyacinthi]